MKSCMAPLTVKREVPKYEGRPTKSETMASLHVHVTTLTVLVFAVIRCDISLKLSMNLHIFQQNFSDMKLVITSQSVANSCIR